LIVVGCIIFPPAIPFVAIIMILIRIGYLFQHSRAIFYGIIVYAIPVLLNYHFTNMGNHSFPVVFNHLSYYSHSKPFIVHLWVFLGAATVMHFLLMSLYKQGYVLKQAITLMLEFPVLIILLVIAVAGVFDAHLFDKPVGHYDFNAHDYNGGMDPPGFQHIDAYVRHGSNGDWQIVKPHIRTIANGIQEDNLSYIG